MVRLDDGKAAQAAFSFLRRHLADPSCSRPSAWAFLGEEGLRSATASLPEEVSARYGLVPARSALVAALAYSEGPAEMPPWAEARVREQAASRHDAGPAPIARIVSELFTSALAKGIGVSFKLRK